MRKFTKDALIIASAIMMTATTAFAMEPPKKELTFDSQTVEHASMKVDDKKEPEIATAPPAAVETAPAPVETQPVVAPKTDPVPPTPKVDSTIPARVFCGSPAQRSWKSPLLANATVGREMAATKGWTGAQWDALYELWSCESSWNNFAQNASSAFGIAQFLDSTWGLPGLAYANCSKTVDAREQIRCGLEYIQVVYGTPASALAKHYRDNSY